MQVKTIKREYDAYRTLAPIPATAHAFNRADERAHDALESERRVAESVIRERRLRRYSFA